MELVTRNLGKLPVDLEAKIGKVMSKIGKSREDAIIILLLGVVSPRVSCRGGKRNAE